MTTQGKGSNRSSDGSEGGYQSRRRRNTAGLHRGPRALQPSNLRLPQRTPVPSRMVSHRSGRSPVMSSLLTRREARKPLTNGQTSQTGANERQAEELRERPETRAGESSPASAVPPRRDRIPKLGMFLTHAPATFSVPGKNEPRDLRMGFYLTCTISHREE